MKAKITDIRTDLSGLYTVVFTFQGKTFQTTLTGSDGPEKAVRAKALRCLAIELRKETVGNGLPHMKEKWIGTEVEV